jgi:L-threonylcarbamoyladenylate synthase
MASISHFRLRLAAEYINAGAVIAYPTEAVYGLGCDPLNETAVMNLLTLKQRPVEKGLILIASDFSQLAPYLVYDDALLNKALATWPGAVTWIMPTQAWVPTWLTGEHQSLAVRVTAHPIAKALCQQFKAPLVSTSANPSTKKPAVNALQVRHYFGSESVYIFNGDTGSNKTTSAIYDARTGARLR